MKELELHQSDKQQVVAERQIEKQHILIGTIKPKPGQKLYEIDLATLVVKETEYVAVNADFVKASLGNHAANRKVLIKENHDYMPALNIDVAVKKFAKIYGKGVKK